MRGVIRLLHSKFSVNVFSIILFYLDLLCQTTHQALCQTQAQIFQSFLDFHVCVDMRSQPLLSFSITAFIEIRMRPNTHECSQTVPIIVRVNFDASGLCRSSHVTNTGATGGGPIAYRHDVERNA